MLTAEQIAQQAEKYNGIANIAAINKAYRQQDESHLYPVYNKFDATERAIRRIRKQGLSLYGLEYCYAIERELSNIVNAE